MDINDNLCVFLNNQKAAEELTVNHSKIQISEFKIPIRHLVNTSKRIILSNVYPIITDFAIVNDLCDLYTRTTSQISHIHFFIFMERFAHITSSQRQLYINPEVFTLLHSSITVTQEYITFSIFITNDSLMCFLCKQTGRISSTCKYNTFILGNIFIEHISINIFQYDDISFENITSIFKRRTEKIVNDKYSLTEQIIRPNSSKKNSRRITRTILLFFLSVLRNVHQL